MKRRKGRLPANLALAIGALILAFAIPEALLRWARPGFSNDLFRTAQKNLPGLQPIVADTERYARDRGIPRPPPFLISSDLLWSLQPNYDHSITRIPWVLGEKRTWRVRIGPHGFRGGPVAERKAPGTLRILCLGDSIMFGDKLDEGETIPEQLARLLQDRFAGKQVEVINAAVPGYTSAQGLAQWRTRARALDADVVIAAFGFNDRWPSAIPDRLSLPPDLPVIGRLIGWLRRMESYKALRATILAGQEALRPVRPDGGQPSGTRVPLAETESNVRALVRDATAQGAKVLVVHTAPGQEGVRQALARASQTEGALFIDAAEALTDAIRDRRRAEARLHGLTQACPRPGRATSGVVLHAALPPPVPRLGPLFARVFGDVAQSTVPLTDDGLACDEKAGDGVWSALIPAPPGATVHYVYGQIAPGGRAVEEFDGFPWTWRSAAARRIEPRGVPEIDTYNRPDLMSEQVHPDAAGAGVIAGAIARAIR